MLKEKTQEKLIENLRISLSSHISKIEALSLILLYVKTKEEASKNCILSVKKILSDIKELASVNVKTDDIYKIKEQIKNNKFKSEE